MPSSTESPMFKPLAARTNTVMESMMSKKISESPYSTVYEEYIPSEKKGKDKSEPVSAEFNSESDFSSDSESDEDEETVEQFIARMQVLRKEIIKQSTAQVPKKYQHYFMDVCTPTKVTKKERTNKMVRR